MSGWLKRNPLSVVIGWAASVLAVLIVLQGSGVLHGQVAHYVDVAVGILQIIITAYAKQHVTPVAAPHDNQGRSLVPVSMIENDRGVGR